MNCARNIVTANFSGGQREARTARRHQWDRGQVLCVTGIEDLPLTFTAHFSVHKEYGAAQPVEGIDGQVEIPDIWLTFGKQVYCWIYLTDGESGETVYTITIPVIPRPMPEYYEMEDTGVFDRVVEQVGEYAEQADRSAQAASQSASGASGSATAATASASAAETAKTAAETAQGKAEDAQAASETAAQTATEKAQQTAQDAAQAAQSKADAESAAQRAEAAQTGAESAKAAAETAAQDAAADAQTATEKASQAGEAASAAAQSATAAAQSAASIEGDVQTATQKAAEATAAADQAVAAKNAAGTAQTAAETAAGTATASATTAATKAGEAAQSASSAAQSKTDAEAAATRAERAAATLTVDDALSDVSENPVQNKVVTESVTQLKNALSEFRTNQPNLFYRNGRNLVDRSWFTDGKRIGGDGNISNLASACATEEYIDISDITDGYIGAYYTNSTNGTPLRTFAYMAFYDANKTKLQYYQGGTSATMSNAIVAIPENAKYMRVSFGVLTTSVYGFMVISGLQDMTLINYERYQHDLTVVPADLNEQLESASSASATVDNITGVSFDHKDFAVRTITKLRNSFTFNQNDFTIVKDELWLAKQNSADYTNGTMIFRHKVVDGEITLVGTIDCDFGHLNVVDYSEHNDCLIFGNGANGSETAGNYFVVVPHPLSLGSTALIADVGIKYDVDIGFKVNAVWGSDNFGENNIVILMSNNLQKITKVMLNRDANGEFDGTYITLETQDNLETFGIQGADCWGDNLYVGGQVESNAFYAIKVISLSDYTSKIIKFKRYMTDGTAYQGSVQGVYVGQFCAWIFCNSNAPQTGVCCFLTQYRL